MVRRSFLVYDLLRDEQPQTGFSEKEIAEQISYKHGITPGKRLRRQVAVALRRGLDFGILAKKNNKFLYSKCDSNHLTKSSSRRGGLKSKKQSKRKSRAKRRSTRSRQKSSNRKNSRKDSPSYSRPNLPKAPGWMPKRRILNEEPLSKVRKN